ncbi:MAG TPA: FecR domain-containing protein [Gemmatimonas sp.]|nr:FecR domain-containing protein [Gemmatimonas sp.]
MNDDSTTPRHDLGSAMAPDFEAELSSRDDAPELIALWCALGDASLAVPRDVTDEARAAAWSRLSATIHDPQRAPFTTDVPAPLVLVDGATAPRRAVRRWLVAASIAVAAVGGALGVRAVPVTYQAATTVTGAPVTAVHLVDGSDVWLAPGSSMAVPRALGWPRWLRASARDVRLTGTAFFSVARDGRAFMVHTGDAHVQVLGTRFEVRGATGAAGTQVSVEEGRVAVSAISAGATRPGVPATVLRAGQRATVQTAAVAGVHVTTGTAGVPASRLAAWRTGGLAALDEPLDGVLGELARRFDVEITHSSNIDGRATVSLFYPVAPTIDTVLSDLCTAQGLTLQRTSRGFRITRSGARP